jgi:hypothetical protein
VDHREARTLRSNERKPLLQMLRNAAAAAAAAISAAAIASAAFTASRRP